MPGWFAVFFVLVVGFGIASTVWRVSTARRMAEQSGMDPDDATAMTLMSDDGFEATYLASNLRSPRPPAPAAGAAERLRELAGLLEQA
jgi:hypothetical protein